LTEKKLKIVADKFQHVWHVGRLGRQLITDTGRTGSDY